VDVETEEQSKQWMNRHSANKLKKFKQTYARNLMAIVFLDRKGVLMVEFMQRGAILSEVYSETLKNCTGLAIQDKAWNVDIMCSIPP
jgi:hypothetical protein